MLQFDIADVFILISGWKPPSGATQEMQPDNYHSSLQLFIAIGHQQYYCMSGIYYVYHHSGNQFKENTPAIHIL